MAVIIILLALILDTVLGEPKRFHPLVGFGYLASWLEKYLNPESKNTTKAEPPNESKTKFYTQCLGALAWGLAVIPLVGTFLLIYISLGAWQWLIDSIVLYFCIARKSLRDHILAILTPLQNNDLPAARQAVGYIVSRDTQALDEHGVRCAAIESTLENGADAIFAAIFWGLIAGAPGVLAYRLLNTLDAMWGYRNTRYRHFGTWTARADDIANFIPARLVAISYGLLGKLSLACQAWREQAPQCHSPNAGPVMAAGAGSLNIRIGGDAIYHGKRESRPTLGYGDIPNNNDLQRALTLVDKTIILWCFMIVVFYAAQIFFNLPGLGFVSDNLLGTGVFEGRFLGGGFMGGYS